MIDKNTDRIDEAIKAGGGQLIATGLDILVAGGAPVFTTGLTAAKTAAATRDKFFYKKLIGAVSQIHESLEEADRILLGQTIENLKQEYGEEEFNETFFHKIEMAETETKARMIARALTCACKDEAIRGRFFEIVHIISSLPVSDLKFLPDAVASTIYKHNSVWVFRLHCSGQVGQLMAANRKEMKYYTDHFKFSRLKRFEGLGLMKNISLTDSENKMFLDEELGGLIVKIIEPLL